MGKRDENWPISLHQLYLRDRGPRLHAILIVIYAARLIFAFRYSQLSCILWVYLFPLEPHPLTHPTICVRVLAIAVLLLVLPLTLVSVAIRVLHGPIPVTLAASELAGILCTAWPPVYPSACHLRVSVVPLVCLSGHSADPATFPDDGRFWVEPGLIYLLRLLEDFDAFPARDMRLVYPHLSIVDAVV